MLKIITAVLTVLTLLLMLVTGFTLWGTLAFLLAAAALVGVCFFGEKLSGKNGLHRRCGRCRLLSGKRPFWRPRYAALQRVCAV